MASKKAALQVHSFKDAEQQHVIQPNAKKNPGISLKQDTPGIHISLITKPLTQPVYLALHGNGMLAVTPEAANFDFEM